MREMNDETSCGLKWFPEDASTSWIVGMASVADPAEGVKGGGR